MSKELDIPALLAQAREHIRLNPPTQGDKDEHAISWVLGNLNASTNHQTTREVVEREYYKMKAEGVEQPHPASCRCWNCDIETTGLVKGLRAKIAELQRDREILHGTMTRAVEVAETQKRHLDAIAEALGQPEPELTATAVRPDGWYWVREWDNGPLIAVHVVNGEYHSSRLGQVRASLFKLRPIPYPHERSAYQPDQLAGMVRELRERLEWQRTYSDQVTELAAALQREVAALRADKERLDALESDDVVYLGEDEAGGYRIDTVSGPVYEGDTIREFCDKMLAARARYGGK
jgi:hypothetical protein